MASAPPGHGLDPPAPHGRADQGGRIADRQGPAGVSVAADPRDRQLAARDGNGGGVGGRVDGGARGLRATGGDPAQRLADPALTPRGGRVPRVAGCRARGSERASGGGGGEHLDGHVAQALDDPVLGEEVRVQVARHEGGLVEDGGEQVDVRLDALDPRCVERIDERRDGRPTIRPVGDHLGQQRVVVGRDRRPESDARVHPDPLRQVPRRHDAGRGQEPRRGVLGHDPQLHRVPLEAHVGLGEPQPLPRRDTQLLLDEVESGHRLRDRMLDLQPRVDLQEGEPATVVEQELDGPGALVRRGPRQPEGGLPHRRPQRRRDGGRRRLLDQLLVPALDAALALAEMDERAVRVAQDLDLDVPRPLDVPLQEQAVVAERRRGLPARRRQRLGELARLADDAHPAPAAARARLDQQRVPDRGGRPQHGVVARVVAVVARQHRDPVRLGQRLRPCLVAERAHRRGRRADPGQPRREARVGEPGVLAQEPVARVDRLRARRMRRLEDRVGPQVAVGRRSGAQSDGIIGGADVGRGPVGVGVDGDRPDPQPPAGPHHAQRDLAPVRDED